MWCRRLDISNFQSLLTRPKDIHNHVNDYCHWSVLAEIDRAVSGLSVAALIVRDASDWFWFTFMTSSASLVSSCFVDVSPSPPLQPSSQFEEWVRVMLSSSSRPVPGSVVTSNTILMYNSVLAARLFTSLVLTFICFSVQAELSLGCLMYHCVLLKKINATGDPGIYTCDNLISVKQYMEHDYRALSCITEVWYWSKAQHDRSIIATWNIWVFCQLVLSLANYNSNSKSHSWNLSLMKCSMPCSHYYLPSCCFHITDSKKHTLIPYFVRIM